MLRSVRIVWTEKWHTVPKGPFTVRNLHLISGAREGVYGLSIRRDRKDRKLVCLRSLKGHVVYLVGLRLFSWQEKDHSLYSFQLRTGQ